MNTNNASDHLCPQIHKNSFQFDLTKIKHVPLPVRQLYRKSLCNNHCVSKRNRFGFHCTCNWSSFSVYVFPPYHTNMRLYFANHIWFSAYLSLIMCGGCVERRARFFGTVTAGGWSPINIHNNMSKCNIQCALLKYLIFIGGYFKHTFMLGTFLHVRVIWFTDFESGTYTTKPINSIQSVRQHVYIGKDMLLIEAIFIRRRGLLFLIIVDYNNSSSVIYILQWRLHCMGMNIILWYMFFLYAHVPWKIITRIVFSPNRSVLKLSQISKFSQIISLNLTEMVFVIIKMKTKNNDKLSTDLSVMH